ncbi:MAG: CorA family divalent cation transporter [Suilimivivens sp.]
MIILALGETLEPIDEEQFKAENRSAVLVATSKEAKEVMELAEMVYEGDINLSAVSFCRMEAQQECLAGSFCIPKLLDVLGSRYRILFFINQRNIVIIDDNDFSWRLIMRIRQNRTKQGETREHFIYNFIGQFMSRDVETLGRYERLIMDMEEKVMDGVIEGFQNEIMPIRKELLTLRGYYDQLMDMGKELEENENGFFAKKRLKYFGIIADRADRLMGRTAHLLEYAKQVQDAYQAQVDAQQNRNMQFLTVISTIFFPLTLITGWYGMNFRNMPELEDGYPGVIVLSLVVILGCILIFKKKKIL